MENDFDNKTDHECIVGLPLVSQDNMDTLMLQEVSDIVPPRLLTSDDTSSSDDSPMNKSPESDTSSDYSDDAVNIEDILDSSDTTSSILNSLKLRTFNDQNDSEISDEHPLALDTSNILDEQDEYPLFNNYNLLNETIIDNEFRLFSPERPSRTQPEMNRNTSRIPLMIPRTDISHMKSRIPLPTTAVRRSKRLNDCTSLDSDYKQCTPKKIPNLIKPAIKKNLSTLNLIVKASSGQLHDATKYATEINASNSEGMLLPTSPDELVSIPVTGARRATKTRKMALVSATQYTFDYPNLDTYETLGFYSEEQHQKYFSKSESPAKMQKTGKLAKSTPETKIKKLRWATDLEW